MQALVQLRYSPENLFQNLQGVHKFTFAGIMPSNLNLNFTFFKKYSFYFKLTYVPVT